MASLGAGHPNHSSRTLSLDTSMTYVNTLELRDIQKSFANIPVLKKVDFTLRKGEVHALMGGNGAGKSTLMKILAGVYSRDGGELSINGNPYEFATPRDAEAAGIAMIYQELSLVPTLTVAQNIFLHHEPKSGGLINDRESVRRSREILAELGEEIDPNARVEDLSTGASQIVEIAKALSKNAQILVMDEPTSSLSEHETSALFRIVEKLKKNGISIVYISHRMAEIFTICDRVTVMRDGKIVLTDDCKNVSMKQLVDAMLGPGRGSTLEWRERTTRPDADSVLEVDGLSLANEYDDISFTVRAGEIVGLAGLMGSGRTEIAQAIFGIRPPGHGAVRICGKPIKTTADAIDAGVALVPESRRLQGLVLDHSLRENFMLPNLQLFGKNSFIGARAGLNKATDFIRKLKIKTDSPEKVVNLLSGGNQQKVVLSKWLVRQPKLLILDEPTIGVDIGAKTDIVEIVRDLADKGAAILVISSEFEELLAMSDRILVLRHGKLIDQLDRRAIASEEVLHHAVQG
jgi:ribose transport system ATP-binding protein